MPSVEISVPTTSTASSPSPHTVYHITLRLPLRTFTLTKRYSEFTALDSAIVRESGNVAAPASLPPKTSLLGLGLGGLGRSTVHDTALIETRRQGLEAYLRAINDAPDPRWRATPAWRAFLNLPASIASSTAASSATTLHAAATAPDRPIADPVAWLDAHRELKAHVHAARSALASRDAGGRGDQGMVDSFSGAGTEERSSTNQGSHEAAAAAKKSLLRATALLTPLDQGLREHGGEWSRKRLGEGEVRRRKDLLAAARKEIASLESLATLVRRKGEVDGMVDGLSGGSGGGGDGGGGDGPGGGTKDAKVALLSGGTGGSGNAGVGRGRVLGKETARTRELDNAGVLQLQQQMMAEQDEDLDTLAQAVRRQRELGTQIQQELDVQNDLLTLLDEDVDRVEGKVGVAKKRVGKIS